MPKVTEQYVEEKKNKIMDVAFDLVQIIPLYEITMSDLIKKLKCSQGMIYRYYKSVDEIFVDLMNREIKNIDFKNSILEILQSDKNSKIIIAESFAELGKYIIEVQNRVTGKFYYEIQVGYVFDNNKKEKLLPQMLHKQNMNFFKKSMVTFIMQNIKNNKFKPKVPLEQLVMYAGVVLDGIGNQMAMAQDEKNLQMFEMLSEYIIDYLEIQEE